MIRLHRGWPTARTGAPPSSTFLGAIDAAVVFPGSTRLAIGTPSCATGKRNPFQPRYSTETSVPSGGYQKPFFKSVVVHARHMPIAINNSTTCEVEALDRDIIGKV